MGKQMKWIVDDRDGYKVTCSECGREAPLDRESGEYIKMRRCPYCKGNTETESTSRGYIRASGGARA